jgi:S-adenosylmethionine:tRNA ribosyltransferase-isomerase
MDLFSLSSYQYELPEELIAQRPCFPRDQSRLMILDRKKQTISLSHFLDIENFLNDGDELVFNNTKVIPARLFGTKKTGGKIELLLLKHLAEDSWEALCRPAKKVEPGTVIEFGKNFSCTILEKLLEGKVRVRFAYTGLFQTHLAKYGKVPLPHYIKRESEEKFDGEKYQTVYATTPGAVAAPTAGLHFTDELLGRLKAKGVEQTFLTLHVGLGTFRPVQTEDIRQHQMHEERLIIDQKTQMKLNHPRSRRIIVGTTTCRALESSADEGGKIHAGDFETGIFIYPGYRFKYVDAMLTNFHLPGSTLLMLVSAFAGYDLTRSAYKMAVENRFRFFSYGDAMLIL